MSYTHSEEIWNAWSHALGIILGCITGAIFLSWCISAHNVWATIGVVLYLFGMLGSYIAVQSTTLQILLVFGRNVFANGIMLLSIGI